MPNGTDASRPTVTRVLICDDHDAIRFLLRVTIEGGEGMHVVGEAVDGKAAISEAAQLQPDVILLDLAMPILTGLDALPEIRRIAPDAAIIVFSGFPTSNVAAQVLALGASRYLQKGVSPDLIIATIAQARAEQTVSAAL